MKRLLQFVALGAKDEGVLEILIKFGNPTARLWSLDNCHVPYDLWQTLLTDKNEFVKNRAIARNDMGDNRWFGDIDYF